MLSDVTSKVEKRPNRKRRGRGRGTGLGKTSGRGHKGAAARSGFTKRVHFEGGQVPLARHLPKRGFSNHPFRHRYDVVNLSLLDAHFEAGASIGFDEIAKLGLISPEHGRLKVLGTGELKKSLKIVAHAASESARKKIEAAGGTIELLERPRTKKRFVPRPKAPVEGAAGAKPAKEGAEGEGKGDRPAEGGKKKDKGGEGGAPAAAKGGKKAEKPEKAETPGKTQTSEKAGKADKTQKPEKPAKAGKPAKPETPETSGGKSGEPSAE